MRSLRLLTSLLVLSLAAFAEADVQQPPSLATLPVTCTIGQVVIKTGAGSGLYYCVSTDTWSLVGNASFTFVGAYNAGTTYIQGNEISCNIAVCTTQTHTDELYISTVGGNIGNQPDLSSAQWALLPQGAAGPAGPAGASGPAGPSASPAGSTGQLQFNNASVFGGATTATWDPGTGTLGLQATPTTHGLEVTCSPGDVCLPSRVPGFAVFANAIEQVPSTMSVDIQNIPLGLARFLAWGPAGGGNGAMAFVLAPGSGPGGNYAMFLHDGMQVGFPGGGNDPGVGSINVATDYYARSQQGLTRPVVPCGGSMQFTGGILVATNC